MQMTQNIKKAAEATAKIANVKASIIVTPATISFEDIQTESDAKKLESVFVKSGMKSLGICNLQEIEMGEGYSLTIAY